MKAAFFVWNPAKNPPEKPHDTFEKAMEEAKRISEKELAGIYVLQAVALVTTQVKTETNVNRF